ncbi:Amino acid permease 3 [Forsythia ovata]|uniref:Amino acid permease 3 n=1 Tax=Forsythia ovata TaxID=205694 RepID=A0ABD1S7B3_9LAMI
MVEVEERDEHTSPLLTDYASSSADSHNNSIKRTDIPDPEVGHIRNRSYAEAVRSYLGKKSMWVAGTFIQESYFGYGIAYTITSAISMRAILKSNCYHKEGHDAPCEYGESLFMLLFGFVQVLFSQIPDFHNMELLSIVAAIMSFAYTFTGLALGFAKVVENGEIKGDITGVSTATTVQKVWLSSQAIGDIAFAFTYNVILLDIQDTLKAPPPENKTMKKASATSILITTFFFLCCGCFGYACFRQPGTWKFIDGLWIL